MRKMRKANLSTVQIILRQSPRLREFGNDRSQESTASPYFSTVDRFGASVVVRAEMLLPEIALKIITDQLGFQR